MGPGLLGYLIIGLVVGALAKAIMPGPDRGGFIATTVLGIVGAFVGGLIGALLFGVGLRSFFNPWTWLLALGGTLLSLWVFRLVTRRRTPADRETHV